MAKHNTVTQDIDRAWVRHAAGDLDGAIDGYARVLARQPRNARALYLCGSARGQQGEWADAARLLQRATECSPALPEAFYNLGIAHKELGQFADAVAAYDGALVLRPAYADAHNGRGLALQELGQTNESVAAFASAVEHNPSHADAWNHLGIALQSGGHLSEAADCFAQAVRVRPTFAQAFNNLAIVRHKQENGDAALLACEQALTLSPDFAEAHSNRGAILRTLGRTDEAAAALETALSVNPDYADAHYNLGNVRDAQGRTADAIDCYSSAIAINNSHVDAHWNRSLSRLLSGDFKRGWAEYEWRWQTDQFDAKPFPQPRWDGSNLAGKSILVYAEQGFGDTIQFARCVQWVKTQGAGRVVFAVQHGLGRLLSSFAGVDALVECKPDGTFPANVPAFDVQIPLLSLPALMGMEPGNIPAPVPFQSNSECRTRKLPPSADLKVGLVWAGRPEHRNNKNRSLQLADFAPLFNTPNVQLYSLQKGDAGQQAANFPNIVDLAPDLHDFADTAAALQQLDLLICVDTSVAHLAGTLGVPTWTLLPFAPDWRWLSGRTDTPWYGSMRLFHQAAAGDWAGVMASVAQELQAKAENAPATAPVREAAAPRVSVVIPCYKQAHVLAEAVRSVVAQTFTDWELIVVDDGSPDSASRVARTLMLTHPRLRIQLIEQENAGLCAARNAGIRAAQGQYILPLDADDCLNPDFLARTVAVLDARPEVGIAYTDIQHFGTDTSTFQTGPFTPRAMTQENRLAYCSLYRRDVWETVGGYGEQRGLQAYGDWDFWLGALEQGVQAARVPEALFCYRKAQQSMLTEARKHHPHLLAQIVERHPRLFLPARRTLAADAAARQTQQAQAATNGMGGHVERTEARRILLITDQFWPSVGGSERLTEDVALLLMSDGWQVEVMAAAHAGRKTNTHRGMRIQSCPPASDPAMFLHRLVETRAFDCVLSFVGHWSPFNAAVADLPDGVRVVAVPCINADGYDHAAQFPAVRETFVQLGARAQVVARSSDAGFDARLWSGLNVPTVYLPNAIDCVPPDGVDFRAAHGVPENVPLLLHVGNFYREKNHAGLLNHLREREGDWRLVLIGRPGHADTFTHSHALTLAELDPRVMVIPGAARAEVSAAMQAADILLLSSVAEATPLVLLEAMSHRLPWIATPRCGSAPDHAGGLVVPLAEFGNAIDFLLKRPGARHTLGAAGQEHWRACYTWDKIAPRYALLAGGANALPPLLPPSGAREETNALREEFATQTVPPAAHAGPAVTVVICTHNRADLLKKVLRSYETQTLLREQWELVVVDDGSTDGTARLLQNYRAPYTLTVETLSPNRGLSAARNAGILAANGEIIVFQDDDDAATPDYLAEHLRVHREHPEMMVGVFGVIEPAPEIANSVLYHVLTAGHGLYNYFDDLQDGQVLDFRHFWGNVSSVKRDLLMQFGFFDPQTRWGMDDAELGWRLQGRGLRMVVNCQARLQAIRTLSFDEFCKRQQGQGRAAAWLLRKHPEPYIPFWLNVANAEQRLLMLADGWAKVQQARGQFAALERAGLKTLQAAPDWNSLRESLLALCRIASEHSLLSGFVERQAEYTAQDAQSPPPIVSDKFVSVVVPCYNYARFLPEAIDSLVAQTYPHWEAVIVDDGSTDNSTDVAHELIARYPQHKIRLIEQANTGHPSHARNAGIAATDGPYVLCLDADDELEPTFLSECVGLLERNPSLSIAYTDQTRFTADGTEERFYAGDYHVSHLTQYLPWGVFALFRRQAWVDVGGWQPVGYEDWEFWLSCAERGHTGLRIPRPLARYRKHAEGKYLRDKNEGLVHKARLALNHPNLFGSDALRRAEGIASAADWQGGETPAAVSVVLVTQGNAARLRRSVKSIETQTLAPHETIHVSAANFAADMNRVLPNLTGEYVALIEEGAVWHDTHLHTLAAFAAHSGAAGVYSDTNADDGDYFDVATLLLEPLVPTSACLFSQAVLMQTAWDTSLPPDAALWDITVRLSDTHDVVRLPRVTVDAAPRTVPVRDVLAIYEKHQVRASAGILAAQKARLEELASAPPSAFDLNARGVQLWQQGDTQNALLCFVQALEIDPAHEDATLNCADALRALGHDADAHALLAAWEKRAA